ncbi:MAG: peptidoglycan D,D-transpeptidase FtsI family protein, partial [bacterium]
MKTNEFHKKFNLRVKIIYVFFLLFCFLILYKLVEVHIIKYEFYEKKSKEQSIGRITIPSYRGRILDRNGNVLAFSLPAYSLAIRPNLVELEKIPDIYKTLIKHNIKNDFFVNEQKFKNFIINLREENVPFYFIKRKISNRIEDLYYLSSFKGIEVIKEPTGKRFYNFQSLREIIGTVDIDEKGIEGIELYLDQHNNEIKGRDGYYDVIFDALGRPNYNRVVDFKSPVDGKDVTLSLDVILQESVNLLALQKLEEHKASEVTIVVCNKKGEILACVSVDRDNNDFVIGGINKLYEPGSIFKIFTVLAALESGASPSEKFFSGPSIIIDGWTINNADDGLYTSGYETIEDILTYSFNVGTVSLMLKTGKKNFIEYLHKLGFYDYSGVEHPSDVKPYIGDLKDEPTIRFATISFGQGIAISPLHILRLMTVIANGGYMVPLTFLK